MSGHIYCFSTMGNPRIYKAGMTSKGIAARFANYSGPSKPLEVIFTRAVSDVVCAEKDMLALLRQCTSLRQRNDMGVEWFETTEECVALRHEHLLLIGNLVSRVYPTTREETRVENRTTTFAGNYNTSLPCMANYFLRLDEFVRTRAISEMTADALRTSFEEGERCPIFAEYALCDASVRTDVIRNRYALKL